MPLNGWSYQNFKFIGDSWGEFLKIDDATLKEESFDKGKVLIVTRQIQKIIGSIELDILGTVYSVRVEEDESFSIIDAKSFPLETPFVPPFVPLSEESKKSEERSLNGEMDENTIFEEPEISHKVMEPHANSQLEEEEKVGETPNSLNVEKSGTIINDEGLQMVMFKPQLCNNTMGSLKVNPTVDNNQENINTQKELDNAKTSENDMALESNWSATPKYGDLKGSSKDQFVFPKIKKRLKSVEELIGIPKHKKGGKKSKKCVVFRSAIAAAALSVSTEGTRNRNRIILDEKKAAWTITKIIGEDFMGNDEEVISRIMITDDIVAAPYSGPLP